MQIKGAVKEMNEAAPWRPKSTNKKLRRFMLLLRIIRFWLHWTLPALPGEIIIIQLKSIEQPSPGFSSSASSS
jgi:hypothetical protein